MAKKAVFKAAMNLKPGIDEKPLDQEKLHTSDDTHVLWDAGGRQYGGIRNHQVDGAISEEQRNMTKEWQTKPNLSKKRMKVKEAEKLSKGKIKAKDVTTKADRIRRRKDARKDARLVIMNAYAILDSGGNDKPAVAANVRVSNASEPDTIGGEEDIPVAHDNQIIHGNKFLPNQGAKVRGISSELKYEYAIEGRRLRQLDEAGPNFEPKIRKHYGRPFTEEDERMMSPLKYNYEDMEGKQEGAQASAQLIGDLEEAGLQHSSKGSGQEETEMENQAADSHLWEPFDWKNREPSSRLQSIDEETKAIIEAYYKLSKEAKSQVLTAIASADSPNLKTNTMDDSEILDIGRTFNGSPSTVGENAYATIEETVRQNSFPHSSRTQKLNADGSSHHRPEGRKPDRAFMIKKVAFRPLPDIEKFPAYTANDASLSTTPTVDVPTKDYQQQSNDERLSASFTNPETPAPESWRSGKGSANRDLHNAENPSSEPEALNIVQEADLFLNPKNCEQDVEIDAHRQMDIESRNTVGPSISLTKGTSSDLVGFAVPVKKYTSINLADLSTPWKKISLPLLDDMNLPTSGPLADKLWQSLTSPQNEKHLQRVVSHALELHKRTGRAWKGLYYRVLLRALQLKHLDLTQYHENLYPTIHPTREQFLKLVTYGPCSTARHRRMLQSIYRLLPFRNLYTPVIQHLYKLEELTAAVEWHRVFIDCKDVPADSQDYRPLFRYMVLYGHSDRLAGLVRQMLDQEIPLPTFITRRLPDNPLTREVIDQQLALTHGVPAKPDMNAFHARLFATRWFSTDTVINILRMLGADTIGPASLRELALREHCDLQAIRTQVEQMKDIGILFAESTFCNLIQRLIREENDRLLENVVNCDLHTDTFEDRDLQESLLAKFFDTGQHLEFDRTLAILLASEPEEYHTTIRCNLQLRLYLRQKDLQAVKQTIEMMQASRLPLSIKSVHYVRIALLSRRRVSVQPRTTNELNFIINIWQGVLRMGGSMPANQWVEILRRLGMTGRLEDYENLALWLADWYSSSPARAYLGSLVKPHHHLTSSEIAHSIHVPKIVKSSHRNHPLNVLFPVVAQQSIVAWGFQHAQIGGPGWRWGLYLLLKLRQRNVHIKRQVAQRACRLRLTALFGRGKSNRPINRRESAKNWAHMGYYIEEMEKICGKGFIRPTEWRRIELDKDKVEETSE